MKRLLIKILGMHGNRHLIAIQRDLDKAKMIDGDLI